MASQTETDEVAALKRRIEELERAVAEHESGAQHHDREAIRLNESGVWFCLWREVFQQGAQPK